MASFRINNDIENNPTMLRTKAKENVCNQKRSVLGVVNSNSEAVKNSKNLAQEKGGVKSKAINKNNALGEKGNMPVRINGVLQKPKNPPQAFTIYEDNAALSKAPATLKNENKVRVLKEKKNDAPGCENDFLPLAARQFGLPQPRIFPPAEPMSPDSIGSPMDVALKTDPKMSKETESALKDLDHLNLTERLYMCEEYRDEISLYLRALQHEHRPRKNYMSRQPDITYNMRAILVDWLVEVVEEYKMTNETLYLAVSYIDRFFSSMSVIRSKLQLVGTAAMFIAAKYEEIYPPDVKDFVYITDDTFTKKQVLRMEHLILRILHFDLSVPTALNFVTDYTSHYPTPDNVKYLAMYLCELSLLQGDPYLGFLPSEIAAGALCVARNTLLPDEDVMPPELHEVLDVQLVDIMNVICALEATHRAAESSAQQASRDKFKTDKYLRVALVQPTDTDCNSILTKVSTPEHHSF